MTKLDRSRPFGEASGGGISHRYEQDGLYFDAAGNQVGGAEAALVPMPLPAEDPEPDIAPEVDLAPPAVDPVFDPTTPPYSSPFVSTYTGAAPLAETTPIIATTTSTGDVSREAPPVVMTGTSTAGGSDAV